MQRLHSLAIMSLLNGRQHLLVSKMSKMLIRDDSPGPNDSSATCSPESHSSLSDDQMNEKSEEMRAHSSTVASFLVASKDSVSKRMLRLLRTKTLSDRIKRAETSALRASDFFAQAFGGESRDNDDRGVESSEVAALTQQLVVSSTRQEQTAREEEEQKVFIQD